MVWPEDRIRPIRMTHTLPLLWVAAGAAPANGSAYRGEALRGEFFTFQIGAYAPQTSLALHVRWTEAHAPAFLPVVSRPPPTRPLTPGLTGQPRRRLPLPCLRAASRTANRRRDWRRSSAVHQPAEQLRGRSRRAPRRRRSGAAAVDRGRRAKRRAGRLVPGRRPRQRGVGGERRLGEPPPRSPSPGVVRPAPPPSCHACVCGLARTQDESVAVELAVGEDRAVEAGDGEPWRHSRLRWLDSTAGAEEEEAPEQPQPAEECDAGEDGCVQLQRREDAVVLIAPGQRQIALSAHGLPASLKAPFSSPSHPLPLPAQLRLHLYSLPARLALPSCSPRQSSCGCGTGSTTSSSCRSSHGSWPSVAPAAA